MYKGLAQVSACSALILVAVLFLSLAIVLTLLRSVPKLLFPLYIV